MVIEIDPLDTLFFKDGKPFSMGEETWADGVFPPFPSSIYGALRSRYFSEHIDEFREQKKNGLLDTDKDPTYGLKIISMALRNNNGDTFYAMPNDLLEKKEERDSSVYRLKIIDNKWPAHLNKNLHLLYAPDEDVYQNAENALLNECDFADYLGNKENKFSFDTLDKYLDYEPKVGIARNRFSHAAESGKLYRVGMRRLKGLKIVVEFSGLELPETGFLKLGSEGKCATYSTSEYTNIKMPSVGEFFTCYLATPAIFNNGWLPGDIDEQTLKGTIHGVEVRMITAATGKPLHIGGYDMKARRPKKMYKAVPAGSVYYFQLVSGKPDKLSDLHVHSISDKLGNQGFGIAYVGLWKGSE